ncbi:putative ankyrin repeat-containing domain superfamily [Septoria linicola]|nr:putative ankyrin repeat-containing domain superfamily [Septoria linicola]
MGFDTMRSYEQFMEQTFSRARTRSSDSDKIKRQDSCMFDSELRQEAHTQPQESLDSSRKMRQHKPSSLSPAIPAFQAALSKWSPPPSPGSASPGTPQALPEVAPARTPSQIANSIYISACAGDFQGMQSAITQGASVNCSVLVPGIFETFKPAKSGHLSPLAGAASHGQLGSVKYLVSAGAEISPSTTRSASSPLHQACRSNSLAIVKFLLEHGADVNIDNAYKVTPIMYACRYSSSEIVSLLLQYQPDLSKVSFIGSTALNWAVFPGKVDAAELLLRAGGDPNQAMPDGNTSLHCAVLTGNASMVKVMLQYGADPFLRNEANETALQLTEGHVGNEKIVAMLKTVIAMCQQRRR